MALSSFHSGPSSRRAATGGSVWHAFAIAELVRTHETLFAYLLLQCVHRIELRQRLVRQCLYHAACIDDNSLRMRPAAHQSDVRPFP